MPKSNAPLPYAGRFMVRNENYQITPKIELNESERNAGVPIYLPMKDAMTLLIGVEAVVSDSTCPRGHKNTLAQLIKNCKCKIELAQNAFDNAIYFSDTLSAAKDCENILGELTALSKEVMRQDKYFPNDRLRGALKIIGAIVVIALLSMAALFAFPALPVLAVGAFAAAGSVGGGAALAGGAAVCLAGGVMAYKRGVSDDFQRMHDRIIKTVEAERADNVKIQFNTINHALNLNVDDTKLFIRELLRNKTQENVNFLVAHMAQAARKQSTALKVHAALAEYKDSITEDFNTIVGWNDAVTALRNKAGGLKER